MSELPGQMIRQEYVSIVTCGQVDSGKYTTTGRLPLEVDGIPERKLNKLTQEAERLDKSSLVFTFYMDRQSEEWERDVNIVYSKKVSFTDKWHYIITDTPGQRDFIKTMITGVSQSDSAPTMVPADGKFTTANAKGHYSARAIQGQTRQHSRSSNLLEKKQIYNGVNKMDCDTASYEQEWIRFVSPDNADVNALSSSLFEYDIVKAVSNDTWMQSNSVEANFGCFHRISVFGPRFLVVENRFFQDVSQEMWQTQAAHQSNKNYVCDDYVFEFENDYIFVFANEVHEKTTIELDDVLEENYMTDCVKTINGTTISMKCNR